MSYTAAELLRSIREAQGVKLYEHRPMWILPPDATVDKPLGGDGKHEWCGILCVLAKGRGISDEEDGQG